MHDAQILIFGYVFDKGGIWTGARIVDLKNKG